MKAKKSSSKPSSEPSVPHASPRAAVVPTVLEPDAFVAEHAHRLAAYPDRRPGVSVVRASEQAVTLLELATPRRAALVAVGLDPRHLDELPTRIALARACHTVRAASVASYSTEERAALDACARHRDELMRICRHALRKVPDAQAQLTELAEGKGVQDLLEDSRALRHLVQRHADLVRRTSFEPDGLVAEAVAHEEAIGPIATRRSVHVRGGTVEVARRNQAVHCLLEAAREVRDHLAFAFPRDAKLGAQLKGLGAERRARGEAERDEDEGDGLVE